MFRKTVFASLIALGNAVATASGAAQAADQGPQLVNRNGSQEVVYDQGRRANVVGGAFADHHRRRREHRPTRPRRPAPASRSRGSSAGFQGGGDDETITYTLPAAGRRARLNTGSRGAALSSPRDAARATGIAIR